MYDIKTTYLNHIEDIELKQIFIMIAMTVSVAFMPAQAQSLLKMFAADSALIEFSSTHIVAEPMTQTDAPATYEYTFRNTGVRKVKISRVVSTCSCLYTYCDKEAVSPGDTAVIYARFNPKGLAGKTENKIFVYTKEGNGPAAVLKMTVNVENTMDGAGQYPISMGGINLKRNIVRFKKGVAATESIGFVNMSGRSLKFDCDRALLPDCLRFYAEPVRPMKEGVIKISYDPSVPVNADELVILLQGLGLPPSKSSIKVIME